MKIRKLKSKLSKAGFVCLRNRGKGSHRIYRHPNCSVFVIQSGQDGQDAKPYQIKNVRLALQQIDCSYTALS
ncbi:type II toxin-antitoxin system HicA family toxin [Myxosarcina sp. GI1]|uniref:type II toxin-antitoxin system HicA family toxin n=1 Tax=Myxosarcina sp. GI1 TaxID=1541065 RepID=UPI000560AF8C|nr:type II toxin-antitoxin system HicA family toxin [Myxosarcina sp. GI1]